ncbi:MAG: chromosome segregation protein SMC [bacterium]
MYLENLHIHGFKSFGRKTKFQFTDGITAIVGPNGCGKSNIVDAIRWVLGEQKAGIIRSERMENVIFNGSETIKPLGMAEVSLTIHNTKNVLPIEYSEVVITRRLFRSLESQYLLNNVPCRLKDIQNLFMDTGMGADAYSIIELSMVETILNGKPEERRHIFEEAAGVTKYKMRRKAAFRKLEATEADIQRLDDIISEVEKNVASLQRQVKKAKRYQELKHVLKEQDIRFATQEYSKLQAELEPLLAKLHVTQDQRTVMTSQLDEKEAKIEEARLKLLAVERNLSARQKELNLLSTQIHKKEEQILVDRERRKAIEDTKIRLARDKEEINSRIGKTGHEITESKESLQNLFEEIQIAETDFQEKNLELKAQEVTVQEKRDKLHRVEKQRLQAVEGLTNSKQEEERIKTKLENIDERLAAIERELEENSLLKKIRQDKITKLETQKSELNSEFGIVRQQQQVIKKNIQRLEQQKEAAREAILNKRSTLQTLKERIDLLKKFIESYEDHPEGVQMLLTQGYLNGGCKGTLAEVLTVDSDYRKAVEAALGDAAVSLIVDETEQALNCIEVLKSQEKGPVTFFPLDRFLNGGGTKHTFSRVDLNDSEGVIGWASNLVTCKTDFQPMVDALLQDFLIVSDLKVARQHAHRLRDQRINVITLNGEIVSTWGPIKGGTNGSEHSGVIGRKALVEELAARHQRISDELGNEEKLHLELKDAFQKECERELELSKKIKEQEHEINELEMQLAQLSFEAKKEEEARERFRKERSGYLESKEDLDRQIGQVTPSLESLMTHRQQFDTVLNELSTELHSLESGLKEYRDAVEESHVQLVDLKSQERHLQENIAKLHEFERELKKSLLRIDEETQAASQENTQLEKRIEANKKEVQIDLDAYKALDSSVNEIEEKFIAEKERIEKEEKIVKHIRADRDHVSENVHEMDLRVSELKMNAENIRTRIKDEYKQKIQKAPIEDELDMPALSEEIEKIKNRLQSMEPVNLLALSEYEKEKTRLDFLKEQKNDLREAEANLNETINVINKTAREQFLTIFEQIKQNFVKVFTDFFENGQANLKLSDNDDPLESEILIEADPKGRRIATLTLLSGGEKTLTALSLLFAIYLVKPSPFCILDEVDAPLDDVNIGRFNRTINNFSNNTQFIVVTHNKLSMSAANALYGITMQEQGVSKVVSVNFEDMDVDSGASKAA